MNQYHDANRYHDAAEELDGLISAHQAGRAEPALSALEPMDAELATVLLAHAAATHPDPDFVARLEARLARQAKAAGPDASAALPQVQGRRKWLFLRRHLRYVAAAALFCLLLASLLAVPAARAALRDLLYGYALVQEAQLEDTTVAVAGVEIPAAAVPLTLAQVRQQATFAVPSPGWLPDGLAFTGGHVRTEENGTSLVTLTYHGGEAPPGPYDPVLLLIMANGALAAPPLLPAERGEWVQVHGHAALYLHGGWQAKGPATPEGTLPGLAWDEAIDDAWLSWEEDGLTYLLHASELGLGPAEMVRIAESLE